MKIVFFDYVLEPDKPGDTGLSDIVWNTAMRLVPYGDDVHIVAPYTVDDYPSPDVKVHRFPIPPVGYRNIFGHMLIVLAASRLIKKLGPIDLIHVPEYLSSGMFPLLHRHTPVVLNVPGNIHHRIETNASFDWITDQVFRATTWTTVRYCARIIATCETMERWWQYSGAPPARIVTIPNGVDTEFFRPVPDARALLGIGEQTRAIVCIARLLIHVKGLDHLLRAVKQLREKRDDFELHLVGSGPDEAILREMAHELGIQDRVIFHGWVRLHELPTYYSAADVTVLPSLAEGHPRVMWQALACGSPFLGTEGVIDGIVDGQTGFLVPPADAEALAARLEQILDDRDWARSVAEQGLRHAREQASWDVVIRRIRQEVYEPLVWPAHPSADTISAHRG